LRKYEKTLNEIEIRLREKFASNQAPLRFRAAAATATFVYALNAVGSVVLPFFRSHFSSKAVVSIENVEKKYHLAFGYRNP